MTDSNSAVKAEEVQYGVQYNKHNVLLTFGAIYIRSTVHSSVETMPGDCSMTLTGTKGIFDLTTRGMREMSLKGTQTTDPFELRNITEPHRLLWKDSEESKKRSNWPVRKPMFSSSVVRPSVVCTVSR